MNNTPVKKWFIRRVAIDTALDERVVDEVVSHQFAKARKAMNDGHIVEISGFGRFYFRIKKAKNKVERLKGLIKFMENTINDPSTPDNKRRSMQVILGTKIGDLKILERKIEDGEKTGYEFKYR